MTTDKMVDLLQAASTVDSHGPMVQLPMWISFSPGEFSLADVYRDFEPRGYHERIYYAMQLEQYVEEGKLQRVGNKRGWYRPTQLECQPIDFAEVDERPADIFWPLDLHKFVNIYPGNIVTIAGEKNAGKTAFFLNLARMNRGDQDVHYFNSEMGGPELVTRLRKFKYDGMAIEEWNKIKFYERSDNFAEVIKPGEGVLNIIDFLECHDEFYKMGGLIKEIFDALKGAVAVIAIQKNPGQDDPIGGRRSTEKSRLHLSMSPGKIKMVVAKNWAKPDLNPNGLECNYKLVQGYNFIPKQFGNAIWVTEGKEDGYE